MFHSLDDDSVMSVSRVLLLRLAVLMLLLSAKRQSEGEREREREREKENLKKVCLHKLKDSHINSLKMRCFGTRTVVRSRHNWIKL